jgi:uncharacterized protein (TIGR04255 family)
MTEMTKIDVNERFPVLPHAPILEAVIEVKVRGEVELARDIAEQQIKASLPDYPSIKTQNTHFVQMGFDGQTQHSQWEGFRLTTEDGRHIAQFLRDRFAFSRLAPYRDWDHFCSEGLKLWDVYGSLVRPLDILRLGVRFINRITGAAPFKELLRAPPSLPEGLPVNLSGFLHRERFNVRDRDYVIQQIQTLQPPQPPELPEPGIVLDIDVFTTAPFAYDPAEFRQKLAEMRWLKDKAFFGALVPAAIERFKGEAA